MVDVPRLEMLIERMMTGTEGWRVEQLSASDRLFSAVARTGMTPTGRRSWRTIESKYEALCAVFERYFQVFTADAESQAQRALPFSAAACSASVLHANPPPLAAGLEEVRGHARLWRDRRVNHRAASGAAAGRLWRRRPPQDQAPARLGRRRICRRRLGRLRRPAAVPAPMRAAGGSLGRRRGRLWRQISGWSKTACRCPPRRGAEPHTPAPVYAPSQLRRRLRRCRS